MTQLPNALDHRKAEHLVNDIFLRRWSPRAMSGESIPHADLLRLLEAARWAPSTYNEQEWRFLYAARDSRHWQTYFDLLMKPNQAWCDKAAVLLVVLSHRVFSKNGKPNFVHTFDAGAAFQNFCLQGTEMGLVVHGMGGFDRDATRVRLQVPDDYAVEAMIAVGRPGNLDDLPEELREREIPTGRNPVASFTCEGPFAL
ncbi:MAG: nitroreductase family protein [Planctomycetota bacterium]|nr:nitroreductase family protein [Planctomycetota bacterium]